MQLLAAFAEGSPTGGTHLVVYINDVYWYRPVVYQVQRQLWVIGICPPRTTIDVQRLNDTFSSKREERSVHDVTSPSLQSLNVA